MLTTDGLSRRLLDGEEKRLTPFLLLSCLVASSGGLLFGYDHGISAGVTSTDSFLRRFFPEVSASMKRGSNISNYCKFDSQMLTLFTSSLYFAGFSASFFSSHLTAKSGCRISMRVGAAFFFAGAAVGASALNLGMLILSRLLLGFGLSFTNQSVPLYLTEMAPPRNRGAILNLFDLCISSGILLANLVNYCTQKIESGWGWRLSLGLAAVPAATLAAGTFFLSGEAAAPSIATAERSSIGRRRYRPQLVMAVALPLFQQLTGINLVTYYAPAMFRSVGVGESAALLSAVATRLAALGCNVVSLALVDRAGRRAFFFLGGAQMVVAQASVGGIMAAQLGEQGTMGRGWAGLMLLFLSIHVAGFGWSWGPLPWLVSEIFPAEIRSAAQSVTVAAGFLFNAAIAQGLLTMLCRMKWGIFFFFGGWVLAMTLFVYLLVPETAGIPVDRMATLWKNHWYWKRFLADEQQDLNFP